MSSNSRYTSMRRGEGGGTHRGGRGEETQHPRKGWTSRERDRDAYQHHYGPTTTSTSSSSVRDRWPGPGGEISSRFHVDRRISESSSVSSSSSSSTFKRKPDTIDHGERIERIKKLAKTSSSVHYCSLCGDNIAYKSVRDLDRHLTMRHYEEKLSKYARPPFACLHCNFVAPEHLSDSQKTEEMLMHYGCEEGLARKYYNEDCLSPIAVERKPGGTARPDVMYKPPEPSPLPLTRVRKTLHIRTPGIICKKNVAEKDVQKERVAELEQKLKTTEDDHKEALKKKEEAFERWIVQKENALTTTEAAKGGLEEKLQQASIQAADFEKQLEHLKSSSLMLEAALDEKTALNQELVKDKKQLKTTVKSLERSMSEVESNSNSKIQECLQLKTQILETDDKIRDLELTVEEKTDEIKELGATHDSEKAQYEKRLGKLEKQVEFQKAYTKELQNDMKDKLSEEKELDKKYGAAEKELKEAVQKLTKENKGLLTKIGQERRQEMKKMEQDNSHVEALEEQLKSTTSKVETLEAEREVLLGSLEIIQKIMKDFEGIISDKNKKIKKIQYKLDDGEANLDEALQKLKTQKGLEKEKKDQVRQIKQLQSTLKDWEARQFTNLKLIAGLQKEKEDLQKKVEEADDRNQASSAEELYEMSTRIKNLEKKIVLATECSNKAEQEHVKVLARLASKSAEVESLKIKNCELESRTNDLEREIRQGAKSEDLESQKRAIDNRQEEIRHLQETLREMRDQCNLQRMSNATLEKKLKTSRQQKMKLEADYSKLLAQYETVKSEPHRITENDNMVTELPPMEEGHDEESALKEEEMEADVDVDTTTPDSNFNPPLLDSTFVDVNTQQIILNVQATEPEEENGIKMEPGGAAEGDDAGGGMPAQDLLAPPPFFPRDATTEFVLRGLSRSRRTSSILEEDFRNIKCGICSWYDPPMPSASNNFTGEVYTIDWVGCKCDRWFHKACTGLSRFTDRFSCRSVKGAKVKCLKRTPAAAAVKDEGSTTEGIEERQFDV